MQVEFLARFAKDLDKIKASDVKSDVIELIEKLERAGHLNEIPNIKKLKGHKTAYRIKVGDYRLGLFFNNQIIELARFVHRKEIYRFFP